jgi:two-component system, OmpR family, sensor histidine kinase KdpD
MSASARARPDPDALLRDIDAAEKRAVRGRLRVYFGASAGVGKTYAMLAAARALHAQATQVLAGVVETHGRNDTAALLRDLDVLPRAALTHRGHTLHEFDLDGALRRHPQLILVDELAHSNAPGSRHAKRWQDVEELLAAGIDVWTTLNAQHLDSLNEAVGSITGVRVWETVPDAVFDAADEVVLVDLPPDELLRRLREGKVYLPDQARHAARNFFRKGNLIALRELALRRTADRVDDDVQAYRRDSAIANVWRTREAVLACLAAADGAESVVRGAHRLAQQLDCDLHVITVEVPRAAPLPASRAKALQAALALAQSLEAHVETLSGTDMVEAVSAYVRRHNITKAVLGRTETGRGLLAGLASPAGLAGWLTAALSSVGPWRRQRFADRLAAGCPDLDVIRLAAPVHAPPARATSGYKREGSTGRGPLSFMPYVWSGAYCAIATLVSLVAYPALHQTNIVMFYLLAVMVVALRHGRGPAALASVISVMAFDFFFVLPLKSFAVSDVQYLLTFLVLLAVGLLVGQLTAGLREQARLSARRASVAHGLYEFARELSSALLPEQIVASAVSFIDAAFSTPCALLVLDEHDRLRLANTDTPLNVEMALGQWVFDHAQPAGAGTATLSASPLFYLPLKAPMRTRGVLVIQPPGGAAFAATETRRQLETYATVIAIAIERLHYVEVAQTALVDMTSEQLRNSLLAAVSHDLRTPLTSLVGMSENLLAATPPLPPSQREIAAAMRQQAYRMHALVVNLLDMARLQNREVTLRKEWQSVEELVGAALADTREPLRGHRVSVAPLSDLPLVECDGVLLQRVLCNLLENAAKYTPPGSQVRIEAEVVEAEMHIAVADDGPGVAPGAERSIFQKFVRGERESATPGVGLGLAVCQAIMSAHDGRIWVEAGTPRGARFIIALPLRPAPDLDPEAGADTH